MNPLFNYDKWRMWLQAKATELRSDTIDAKFGHGPDDGPKPGMTLGVAGRSAMGEFAIWVTGEMDYTIMAPPSPEAKMVSNRWGLKVTDATFEATFNEFLSEFHKHNVGP